MRIIIPSYNRYSDGLCTTHTFFSYEYRKNIVLLVREEQYKDYMALGTGCDIVVTPKGEQKVPGNVGTHQRKRENLMEVGEWYIFMDDNILGFTRYNDNVMRGLEKPKRDSSIDITGEDFVSFMEQDMRFAERVGFNMIGTANIENHFFRKSKYSQTVMCQHKCCAVKKIDNNGYDLNVKIREEYDMSAFFIVRDGGVARNNYLFAKRKHFMKGGIGTYEDRLDGYRHDSKYLSKKYPGLIRINNNKSGVKYKDSEVSICGGFDRNEILFNLRNRYGYDI